ncbi:intercellular adhesion molecule 5 isoform X2 [Seriola aureovittata]|uniref:intercellular adhesion molecule 5 isoform X2 n=1 Tax=Seriola aureovittata TaxID=2871759 RepID=UPI0024BEEF2F|nr:intercellular adhesion molecule 5 isoform X2 [Seriola aureovittata]
MMPLSMLGLLMLMPLLCDADSTCTDDVLILNPSKVIVEYGGEVIVNCTNPEDDHDGIYWTNGTTDVEKEEYRAFVSLTLTPSDWDARAQCKLMRTGNVDCTKDLEITVYKNPDGVDMFPIKHVEATVEGMQYQLQCDISEVAPVQNLTVRWYKDNEIIMIDSFTNTNKLPVSESSILTVNISRKDNGAQFRCEAQLDFEPSGPKLPAFVATHNVSVRYAPVFTNDIPEVHIVEEDNNVTLDCEAEGHPPPHFQWTRDGVNMMEYTDKLIITQVNTNTIYTCIAANDLGRITKTIHVNAMRYPPTTPAAARNMPEASPLEDCPLTLTPAELVVRFGDPASSNCTTSVTDAAGMGWEAAYGGTGFEKPPTVTWAVKKLTYWHIQPNCYITRIKQCKVSLAVTLYKTPNTVSVSEFHPGPMEEGKEHQLKCDIISVAPVQNLTVKWYRGNESVMTETFNDTTATPVNVSSTLRVTPKRDYNRIHFSCSAELHLGPNGPEPVPTVISEPYTADVRYKPLIHDCPTQYTGVEHNFSLNMLPCKVDGNPPPVVNWTSQGKHINASQSLTRGQSGVYIVEAVNELGESSTSVTITIEYKPSFACEDSYEVKENDDSFAGCEPEGKPLPTVTWYKDGVMVSKPPWTKRDSGKYVLLAKNKHGTANHTLSLNVQFAPEFKEANESKEVTLGQNVTVDCSAEGNPGPVIQWNYTHAVNVRETTWGRQATIIITGATSTNAGVYICVATNEVGSVSRYVTLAMKGKTAGFPWTVILGVCLFLILTISVIILYLRWKKHGQYSFVPDKARDGSEIPMTTKSDGVKA